MFPLHYPPSLPNTRATAAPPAHSRLTPVRYAAAMLLLHCSPRVHLHRLSPSRRLPLGSSFPLPGSRRRRRSTAICADPEAAPPPLASAAEPDPPDAEGQGPVELRAPTLFSIDDNPTPLQTATSLLLTGAISVFLFRSLRRRARRAKELRVRSSGVKKKPNNLTEEALEGLRLVSASPIETEKPPSPIQALLGGIAAGVIALILYKFTTTIEAALNRQNISDSFSVELLKGKMEVLQFAIYLISKNLRRNFRSQIDTSTSTEPPNHGKEEIKHHTDHCAIANQEEDSSTSVDDEQGHGRSIMEPWIEDSWTEDGPLCH